MMEEMIAECTQMMNSMNGMMGMMGGSMMQGSMMGGNIITPWWILGWLLVIIVIVAVGLAIVWTIRRPGSAVQPGETPLTILKRRYAAGEIDPDQFEKMKVQIGEG